MIAVEKYPAKSGQGRFALGCPAGGRDGAQVSTFAGIFGGALRVCFTGKEVSGRIRPNPTGAVRAGRGPGSPSSALDFRWNFSASRSVLAPNRPYPATGAYGGQ